MVLLGAVLLTHARLGIVLIRCHAVMMTPSVLALMQVLNIVEHLKQYTKGVGHATDLDGVPCEPMLPAHSMRDPSGHMHVPSQCPMMMAGLPADV